MLNNRPRFVLDMTAVVCNGVVLVQKKLTTTAMIVWNYCDCSCSTLDIFYPVLIIIEQPQTVANPQTKPLDGQ